MMEQERYMWRAIDLARRAEPQAISPNPAVGAVLVYNGRVIGEGYHRKVGEAHAEINCLASVRPEDQHLIAQSELYVTLEPCAHEGRTPSCAKRLVAEQVRKVYIGTLDPNPLTAGKGVQILQRGGIEVVVGLLEQACKEVAKVFLCNQLHKRPFITLKWAESQDGLIDTARTDKHQAPAQLSSPFTQQMVHLLRSQQSGILVGRRTYELDQPTLNNRLWIPSPYSPRPILLSSHPVELPPHWLQIKEASEESMSQLLSEGITSLLVEGGAATHRAFIERQLWDEIRREVAPIQLYEGVAAPLLPDKAILVESTDLAAHHTILRYRSEKNG
ncbi:MAG: bifunctional diaminohydroxyphosphoribosylaminopyrimidine deaminase/5-amino-6-(5-phosphoribosylamino)uracil reductase RibD [Porphyromonas sp.]|nr:bifunctional diaminohydroxyphosphoribosylaminopyrimidine deaminase/5-amino-6-(5-phosphoribosylamino)uracil reductase RibD [Porphyromonas sp.]